MINKDLMYSTGNSTQYSITYTGKESEKQWICIAWGHCSEDGVITLMAAEKDKVVYDGLCLPWILRRICVRAWAGAAASGSS